MLGEIVVPGHTRKSQCFDTLTRVAGTAAGNRAYLSDALHVISKTVMCQHVQRVGTKQINTVKAANSWDEHLENLVSIQHLQWKRNTFSFRNG